MKIFGTAGVRLKFPEELEPRARPKVILDRSFGNHYALILGDHTEELSGVARLLGLSVEAY